MVVPIAPSMMAMRRSRICCKGWLLAAVMSAWRVLSLVGVKPKYRPVKRSLGAAGARIPSIYDTGERFIGQREAPGLPPHSPGRATVRLWYRPWEFATAAGSSVKKDAQPAQFEQAAGLCPRCSHVRVIESDRGSRFLLCSLFRSNPRFPKYPRLPVTQCPGFQPDASA